MKRWSQFCYKRASSGGWSPSTAWRTMTFQKVRNGCRTQSSEFQWSLTSTTEFFQNYSQPQYLEPLHSLLQASWTLFEAWQPDKSCVLANMSKETGQGATMAWTAVPSPRATTKPNLRSFRFWKFVSKQQLIQNVALVLDGGSNCFGVQKAAKVYRSFDVNCSWEFV